MKKTIIREEIEDGRYWRQRTEYEGHSQFNRPFGDWKSREPRGRVQPGDVRHVDGHVLYATWVGRGWFGDRVEWEACQ